MSTLLICRLDKCLKDGGPHSFTSVANIKRMNTEIKSGIFHLLNSFNNLPISYFIKQDHKTSKIKA